MSNDNFNWEIITSEAALATKSYDLVGEVLEVFHDGFGISGWSSEGVSKAIKNSTCIALLKDSTTQKLAGYSMYFVPDSRLYGKSLLWENAACIKKYAQGQGLFTRVKKLTLDYFSRREIGWIGGRTQNPLVIRHFLDFGYTFPFTSTYATPEGKRVLDFLLNYVAEASNVKNLNKTYGICKNVYREGRLGDYKNIVSGTETAEQCLQSWGFDRENGDAVLIVAKVK